MREGTCGICNHKSISVLDIDALNFYICEECIASQFEDDEFIPFNQMKERKNLKK